MSFSFIIFIDKGENSMIIYTSTITREDMNRQDYANIETKCLQQTANKDLSAFFAPMIDLMAAQIQK